jgi:hypothetical protein
MGRRGGRAETGTSGRGPFIVEALTAAFWVDPRTYDKTPHAIVVKPRVELTAAEPDRLRRCFWTDVRNST